jgi:hypothetical protein
MEMSREALEPELELELELSTQKRHSGEALGEPT